MGTATKFLLTDETALDMAAAMRRYAVGGDAYFVRPNLLDNWYFGNPVNQLGQTSWSASGYTIDRWALGNSSLKVTVSNGGLALERIATGTWAMLRTSVAPEITKQLWGKTLTVSALIEDFQSTGLAAMELYHYSSANVATEDTVLGAVTKSENGVISMTVNVPEEDETLPYMNLLIGFQGSGSVVGDKYRLVAAKIELGDTQTLAHQDEDGNWVLNEIPDYSEQLWTCQRYYQLFRTSSKRPTYGPDFRPPMRLDAPTLGTVSVGGATRYYADAQL